MKRIKKITGAIMDEIHDAEKYAECYLDFKLDGKENYSQMYREMAEDELKHSENLHAIASDMIERYSNVWTPSIDMREKWDAMHREFKEKTSMIRSMIAM